MCVTHDSTNDSALLIPSGTRWLEKQIIITNDEIVAENHQNQRQLRMMWSSETSGRAITADHFVRVTSFLCELHSVLGLGRFEGGGASWFRGLGSFYSVNNSCSSSSSTNWDTNVAWRSGSSSSAWFPWLLQLRPSTRWPRPPPAAGDGAKGRLSGMNWNKKSQDFQLVAGCRAYCTSTCIEHKPVSVRDRPIHHTQSQSRQPHNAPPPAAPHHGPL